MDIEKIRNFPELSLAQKMDWISLLKPSRQRKYYRVLNTESNKPLIEKLIQKVNRSFFVDDI